METNREADSRRDGRRFDNWFGERRFGMFIHWGLYAIPAWHEQIQMRQAMRKADYQRLAAQFNPQCFNPDEWLDLAQRAGMKYVCFTAKHHDGFCMWDTRHTDYKITNTPYGKDVLAMLAEACHKRDMGLSLYYSVPDWHHPNAYNPLSTHQVPPEAGDEPDMAKYVQYVKDQVSELGASYGKILSFFWDIPPQIHDPSLNDVLRKLQPGIMINDRGFDEGDYATPERFVPEGKKFSKPTEACQSVGRQSWGYRANEDYYSELYVMHSIAKVMAMGGNYLLNIGPQADGTIPCEAADIVGHVGGWYEAVKEAFEGAEPASELFDRDDALFTRRGDALYVHLTPPPESTGFILNPLTTLPIRAVVLNDGSRVQTEIAHMPTLYKDEPYLHLYGIPVRKWGSQVIVIKLEFENLDACLNGASRNKPAEQRL